MFALRRITSESKESNTMLGNSYNVIYDYRNPEEFARTMKIMKWQETPPEVYGFIVCGDGTNILPLYKKSTYFVMSSDGKTFANITYK